MTLPASPPVVVDTMVVSWLLDSRPNPMQDRYRELIGTAPVLLAFQTVAELRYGALRAGWGELRRRRLDRSVARLTVVQPDDEMLTVRPAARRLPAGRPRARRQDPRRRSLDCRDSTSSRLCADIARWTLPEHPRAAARYGRRTLTQLSCSLWAVVVVLLLDPG